MKTPAELCSLSQFLKTNTIKVALKIVKHYVLLTWFLVQVLTLFKRLILKIVYKGLYRPFKVFPSFGLIISNRSSRITYCV